MKKFGYLLLCVFFFSCASTLYVPIENSATISVVALKKGRELYVTNCASCHQLYAPNKYDSKTWMHNLDEMQPKAKITDEQKKLIFDYLVNAPK